MTKLEFLSFQTEEHYVVLQHSQSELSIQNAFILFLLETKRKQTIILSSFSSSSSSWHVWRICYVARCLYAFSNILVQWNSCCYSCFVCEALEDLYLKETIQDRRAGNSVGYTVVVLPLHTFFICEKPCDLFPKFIL